MENVLLRFPHIGCQIFEQLNNPLLTNCREVSNSWKTFIDNVKLPWIKIIVHYIKPLKSSWRRFLQKSNIRSLSEMATLVIQHQKKFKSVPENTTPLHFAAMSGNTEMIERLMQIKAQFNEIKGAKIGKPGKSPIFPQFNILKRGFSYQLPQGKELSDELLHSWNGNRLGIDSDLCTPLHYAARNGHLRAYEVIMEINLLKNPECGYMTPFHMAAKHGHFSICELIINNVEDKNPKNVDDETPLHYAAEGGFLKICRLIIDKVIDKNPGDDSGNTPLHHAVTTGNLAIFKLIFDSIEDKNPQNDDGVTPLHLAAQYGYLEIFQWIFYLVKDKNPRDKHFGSTPLHYAAKSGYLYVCQLIVEYVVVKNPPNYAGGFTPLHLAADEGHYDI